MWKASPVTLPLPSFLYFLLAFSFLPFAEPRGRPVERGWGSFPGPRVVWKAPPSVKNTENGVPDGFFLT